MHRTIQTWLFGLMIAALFTVPAPAIAAEIEDHPAVSRYPGSTPTRRDNDGFRAYTLVLGIDPNGKTDDGIFSTLDVEGNVSRLAFENPRDTSAHEIFANYREGLENGGFEILFSCETAACGPSYASSGWGRVTGLRYHSPEQRYLAAKISKDGQEIYVAILVAKLRHQVEIVEIAEMERGLVSAQGLAEGLLTDGRAVLDGIYFDTDKATLKPESGEALAIIAQFLKDRPDLDVFIVGHTDLVGGFDHNMALARDRATAVVTALTTEYGISRERLSAHGVGPLSPAKSNGAEAGRSLNRRVEMVERSM